MLHLSHRLESLLALRTPTRSSRVEHCEIGRDSGKQLGPDRAYTRTIRKSDTANAGPGRLMREDATSSVLTPPDALLLLGTFGIGAGFDAARRPSLGTTLSCNH